MKIIILSMGMCLTLLGDSIGQVVITEIMYNPPESGSDTLEYIEIYNAGGSTVDISGYKFSVGVNYTFPASSTIDAGEYIVIAERASAMLQVFGIAAEEWSGVSSNSGEPIALYDASDNLVDSVNFDSSSPWPNGAGASDPNGGGASIVLLDPSLDNNVASNWISSPAPLAVEVNGFKMYGSPESYSTVGIGGDEGWRLLSFPIDNPTLESLSDDTPVQGISGGSDESAAANIYLNPASDGTSGDGYIEPTSVSTTLDEASGLAVYFYNNSANNSSVLPIILDAFGAQPSSDVQFTISNTWTLIGNPFATRIQLSGISGNDSGAGVQDGLKGTAQLYDDNTGNFTPVNYGSGVLSPWQGFFVERNSTSTTLLNFPTSSKTTSDASNTEFSKLMSNITREITIKLNGPDNYGDMGILYFTEQSTDGEDAYDSGKLNSLNGAPMFSFQAYGQSLVQDARNVFIEYPLNYEIQFIDNGIDGIYKFSWPIFKNIPEDWEVTFYDFGLGFETNMRIDSSYTFDVESTMKRVKTSALTLPKVKYSFNSDNRFGITIRPTSVNNEAEDSPLAFALDQNYPNPFNPSTTISYTVNEASSVNISVYNLMGQKVATLVDENKSAGQYNVRWNASGVASGMYYYRLEANGQALTRKMTLIK